MRILKFRAWDSNSRQMIAEGFHIAAVGHAWAWVDNTNYNESYLMSNHIMQFTGLTDKNGTEIYEGDIVKNIHFVGGNWIDEIINVYIVEYLGVSFTYKPIKKTQYTVSMIGCEVEIIGNIYANPELINKTSIYDISRI